MKILIDNGHGEDTPGKRSPDGRLLEWKYTREIAAEVVKGLQEKGYDAMQLVPESNDVSLRERVIRVNKVCGDVGKANVILVSIHCNAAGSDGKWHTGRGWEAWTTKGKTESDTIAEYLYKAAEEEGLRTREDNTDGDRDKEGKLYILQGSACPAVLTENLFQDNQDEVNFLLSDKGRRAIIALHVNGIDNYLRASFFKG